MPMYEYQCSACNKKFEHLQKISEPPLTTCPDCKGEVKRIISQTSFSLKGSGWYKDGYGSEKKSGGSTNTTSAEQKTSDTKKSNATPEGKKP